MSKTTSKEPQTVAEMAKSISEAFLSALRERIEALSKPPVNEDDLERMAKLVSKATDMVAECRKLEKAQGHLAQGLTRELVLAWAKQQPRETRARLQTDLIAIDSTRKASVLG